MDSLLKKVIRDYPQFTFAEGKFFYWSPRTCTIFYAVQNNESANYSLLHELSHAILQHDAYTNDYLLIQMELEAWETAKKVARVYNIAIDNAHVEECLDSYREWLHNRSICPTCNTNSTQIKSTIYKCFNCQAHWTVSNARHCRPYREITAYKKSPTTSVAGDF